VQLEHVNIAGAEPSQPLVGARHRALAGARRPSPCRIRLMRLAWDVIGAQFAHRHQQHEKFYSGDAEVVKGDLYRGYDFERAWR
jgi:4-hydroxyphenylacetate 3-monooxygenase